MGKACADMVTQLKECMYKSDCMKEGKSIKECFKATTDPTVLACEVIDYIS